MKIPSLKIKIHKFKKGTVLRTLLILALAGLAVGLGALFGAYIAIKDNLPNVADIDTFRPKLITTIYTADGQPLQGVRRGEARRGPVQPAAPVARRCHRGHRGPQLLPPRRHRSARHPAGRLGRRVQGPGRQASRGRQHHHPAAGPLALPPPRGQPPPQAQGALSLARDREALPQGEDPRALLQSLLPRPRHLRRPGRVQPLLRQGRQGPRRRRSRHDRRDLPRAVALFALHQRPRSLSIAAITSSTGWSPRAT